MADFGDASVTDWRRKRRLGIALFQGSVARATVIRASIGFASRDRLLRLRVGTGGRKASRHSALGNQMAARERVENGRQIRFVDGAIVIAWGRGPLFSLPGPNATPWGCRVTSASLGVARLGAAVRLAS